MSRTEWEARFSTWSQGPGKTESDRCENAEHIITDCLTDAGVLQKYDLRVFTQGSFANRTNIPQESDVDICVQAQKVFFVDYPDGLSHSDFGNSPSTLDFATLKDDVGRALRERFGNDAKRADKCFALRENSYRVDADITPTFEHRRYESRSLHYVQPAGTQFQSDSGKCIINWPKQHISNGIAKHDATHKRFKKIVRILKRLQFDMIEKGAIVKKLIPSYALECCAYNVSTTTYKMGRTYYDLAESAVAAIYTATATQEKSKDWVEVNDLKYLFRPTQRWTREDANKLALSAWTYVGFS